MSRWKWVVIIAFVVLASAPLPFVMIDWYGSADSAWAGVVAQLWAMEGVLPTDSGPFVEMRFRSSPLYVFGLKSLLEAELLSPRTLPYAMNLVAVPIGLLFPLVAYLLIRRLDSRHTAVPAVALLFFSPVFFRLRSYGFPALPALLFFMLALLAYREGIRTARIRFGWLVISSSLFTLAALTKTDVLLLAPSCLVVACQHARPTQSPRHLDAHRVGVAASVVALPGLAALLWSGFCHLVAPSAPETAESFRHFSDRWALHPAGLVDPANLVNIAMAAGVGSTLGFLIAVVTSLFRRSLRMPALACLLCVSPTLLWWGMRELDSSRHNWWIVIPIVTFLAFVLQRTVRSKGWKAALVILVCSVNYTVGPTKMSYLVAPARWFESAEAQQKFLQHQYDRFVTALKAPLDNGRLCFLDGAGSGWIVASALTLADEAEVSTAAAGRDWRLNLVIAGERKQVWLPGSRKQALAATGEWTVIRSAFGQPPFVRIDANGGETRWPPAVPPP
jgi:hypothetical protein